MFLLVLFLVGLCGACDPNGYGKVGEEGCVLVYCNEGHQVVNGTCDPCRPGFYSDSQDLEPCRPCPNLPRRSDPVRYGETTPDCLFRCHPQTRTPHCSSLNSSLTPVAILLMGVAGFAYFVHRVREQKKMR